MVGVSLALLLLAAPVEEERGAVLTHGLIGSYIVASSMDLATTMHCLGARTCREINPALRPLDHRPIAFAGVKTAVAVGVAALLIRKHHAHPRLVRLTALGLTAASVYVAVRNTRR